MIDEFSSREESEAREVWACILIGGRSSRMGQPKHLLLNTDGVTWLERMIEVVEPMVDGVALSGPGEVPLSLSSLTRLEDVPGLAGPLAGILSAMRSKPDVSWLLLACDMPCITSDSIRWLLTQYRAGWWGSLPSLGDGGRVEPLFARYEPESAKIFEKMRKEGILRIGAVADHEKIRIVQVPDAFRAAWNNVNTPEDLAQLSRDFHDSGLP